MRNIHMLFILIWLFSCEVRKEEAYYSYMNNCEQVVVFSFPNLYIYDNSKFHKLLEFKNHIEILGYSPDFIYVNEVVVPYRKNKIHIYDIRNKKTYSKTLKNIDCLLDGGHIFSHEILESEDSIFLKVGCKREQNISIGKINFKPIATKDKSNFKNLNEICKIPLDSDKIKFEYNRASKKHQITINDTTYEIPVQYTPIFDEN